MSPRVNQAELCAAIEAIDLEPIMAKLVDQNGEHGWPLEYTKEVAKWYRRFLYLTQLYPERPIVITEPIDIFWHQHILDTRKYARDCEEAFGQFLHHFPYFGMRSAEDAEHLQVVFQETLTLIQQEFGESLAEATISQGMPLQPTRSDQAPFKGTSCSDCSRFPDDAIAEWATARPTLTF